jgi:hypothetical protein
MPFVRKQEQWNGGNFPAAIDFTGNKIPSQKQWFHIILSERTVTPKGWGCELDNLKNYF